MSGLEMRDVMRPKGSIRQLERRRRRGLAMIKRGLTPTEVGWRLGVAPRSVRRWIAVVCKGGSGAIRARRIPGRPPKLTIEQRRKLKTWLQCSAKVAGFQSDTWTCARVAKLIELRFDIQYHTSHIGRLVQTLGWQPNVRRLLLKNSSSRNYHWIRLKFPHIRIQLHMHPLHLTAAKRRTSWAMFLEHRR
jgi:transposase